ncbi:MAG: GNAT family N-acetyltransferase [Bacillota bacterium]
MQVLETERLILRRLELNDAAFVLELATEPAWLRFIGDRGIRDLETARGYLERGPLDLYRRLGFGLYRVEIKAEGTPVGICGLIKRDTLKEVDIGFAFLSRYHGRGYALEAAAATLEHGRRAFGLRRIAAITDPANARSIRLLEKLGFRYLETLHLPPNGQENRYYVHDA